MLKTSSTKSATPRKGRVKIGGNNKAGHDGGCKLDGKETSNDEVDDEFDDKFDDEVDDEVDDEIDDEVDDEVDKKDQEIFKSKNAFKKLSKSK